MTKKRSRGRAEPPRVPRPPKVEREPVRAKAPGQPRAQTKRGGKVVGPPPPDDRRPAWLRWVALAGLIIAVLLIAGLWWTSREDGAGALLPVEPEPDAVIATAVVEPDEGEAVEEDVAAPLEEEEAVEPLEAEEVVEEEAAEVAPDTPQRQFDAPPEMTLDTAQEYTARISTAKGEIVAKLYPRAAPGTVNNFVFLSESGFYDGLTFHRVEPGFVIQGGDPAGDGSGGPGYTLPAEIELPHVEGALAMARLPDEINPERESSGSQFYITLAPTPHLDGAYTVFGQVLEGMDVVRSIEIGDEIESITIEEGGE